MKLSLDQKLRLGFASMLLVLFSASLLSYLSKKNLVENNQLVSHTQNVLLKLQSLQSNLAEAKAAQLNYVVGGDTQWLTQYNRLHQESRHTIYQIGQLTIENPHQQTRFVSLMVLFDENYRILAQSIGLKKVQQDERALHSSQSSEGYAKEVNIQALIREMRLEEEHLLVPRTVRASQAAFSASVFNTLAFFLSCVMAALFLFQYNKDIRIKKEAASKIEAKEKLITAINNASPDFMYVFDLLEQRNVYVNKEISTILGYDTAEADSMGGEILTDLIHPEDMLTVINKRKSILRDTELEVYDMEYRMRHRDGHYRWLHSREVVFARNEHRRPTQMLGIAQDITDQKNSLHALKNSEIKYRTLVEEAQDMIYETDYKGCYTYVNQVVIPLTGYSREELYKMCFYDLVPESHQAEVMGFYKRQFKEHTLTSYLELPIITKDGHQLWIGQNVTFEFSGSYLERVQVIARDLTALKKAQDMALRVQEVFEATSDYVSFSDEQGTSYVNRPGKQMLGYFPEEDLSAIPSDGIYPVWAMKIVNETGIPYALKHGIWTGETALLTKDGQEIPVSQLIIAHRDSKGLLKYFSTIARDITAIKESQREMEVLQRLNESILDSSPSGILALKSIRDLSGQIEDFEILMLNRSAEVVIGQDLSQLKGKSLGKEYPFFTEEKILETCREVVESGDPVTFEMGHPTDGGVLWMQFSAVKMKDGLVVTYSDINQRKIAELNVITQKEFYENILNSIPSDLVVFDAEHNYLFANPTSIRDSATRKWVIGKDDFAYCQNQQIDESIAIERRKKFDQVVAERNQLEFEECLEEKDGTVSYHIRRMSPVFEADNRLRMVIGYGVDITERRQIEDELQMQRELLRQVIDTSPNFIFVRNWYGKYVLVNQSMADYYGVTAEEAIGKSAWELENDMDMADNEIERDREIISQYLMDATTPVTAYEINTVHPVSGESIWQQMFKVPFIHTDGTAQLLGISYDITQIKAVEGDLIQAREQALQSMKAKEMFLSNMSHEIRTPMNAVIGMTHLLTQENPRPDQAEHLKLLRFSAENLLVLINDILDFSKIEAGKITFESVDFSVRDVLSGIMQSHTYKAEEKKIGIQLEVDNDMPAMFIGDPVRLSQILNNLVSNAVKFTEHGKVVIQVKWKMEENNDIALSIRVKDTGIGIPQDKLSHIFESFTQASSDTTRKFGGTGLGLAITKRLLELQGSAIEIESTLGVGTDFFFTLVLPKSDKTEPANGNSFHPELQRNLSHVKVLLVEDNKTNQIVASKFLNKWGIIPDIAENGRIAVEKVQLQTYDMVLMDLQMPEMDGYEATKVIRSLGSEAFANIPIIALTASALLDVKDKVFEIGMTDYLSKPFNPNELYAKIAKYSPEGPIDEFVKAEEKQPEPESVVVAEVAAYTDLTLLREIARGQVEDMRELINAFLITEGEFNTALEGWFDRKDGDLLAKMAHKFKSCIGFAGMDYLQEKLVFLEKQARQTESADEITQMCQELKKVCDGSVKELEAELAKMA